MDISIVQYIAINTLWRLPLIIILGYYTSLLMSISGQERGISLHNFSILQKTKYWLQLITPNAVLFSSLLTALYVTARLISFLRHP